MLVCSCSLSLFPIASVATNIIEQNDSTQNIVLKFVNENILEEVNSTNCLPYFNSNDLIIAEPSTENPDVYILTDSLEYVMEVSDNQYQLADRVELFVSETSQIDALNVPQEIAQDLSSSLNGYVKGVLFLPDFKQSRDKESVMDYTYKGYNMRQYLYTYNNFEATNVNVTKGIKTKDRIAGAIDFIFTLATSIMPSDVVEKINPYTTAASLLDDFLQMTQSDASFVASSSDSYYITPHWNRYLKFTYCDLFHDGNYLLGLKSICAQLTEIEHDLYFKNANEGQNFDLTSTFSQYIYSPNYTAPDATAIACAATEARLEDELNWNIYSKTPEDINNGTSGTRLCTILIN